MRLHWCGASTVNLMPFCGEQLERLGVGRGLRQPHAFRRRAEAALVVGDAPADLRDAVARAGQRQNHVVVDLRHGRAVAAIALAAAALAVEDHAIGARRVLLEPAEQRGAEVEADARVVVDDAHDLVFVVDDARGAVGRVALGADALVPVVVGSGRVLRLHRLQPGILARRLVKVAVNADKTLTRRHEESECERRRRLRTAEAILRAMAEAFIALERPAGCSLLARSQARHRYQLATERNGAQRWPRRKTTSGLGRSAASSGRDLGTR